MQKLLEVVEIWFVLNLAAFAFIVWYRRPNWTRRIKNRASSSA
jgi:hypothetical protein